jgi:ribonuclease BN (tRNA processing enzyme)
MHLQFVGCGDAFGSGGRFNTCLHLTGRDFNVLIDCGASSLVAMNKLGINRNDIGAIFISHFHGDHIGGVPFFLLESNFVLKREQPLTIIGPPTLKTRFPGIVENAFPGAGTLDLSFPLTLQEMTIGRRREWGAVAVTPYHVVHDDRAGPCLGLRIEAEGKVIAFSGDTEWTESVVDVGRDADLFICECYTRDEPIKSHMALSLLTKHLDRIKPKRLILTHMSDDMLKQRASLPYETAEDGKIVEI